MLNEDLWEMSSDIFWKRILDTVLHKCVSGKNRYSFLNCCGDGKPGIERELHREGYGIETMVGGQKKGGETGWP
jgi:hypothetical protein